MCGITTILAYRDSAPAVDRDELRRINARMIRRGPDDEGEWQSVDRRIGMASRRLAIIDLTPAGHQPMQTEDGRYTIVFNGEIYNHSELRARLESEGIRFRSTSDTEVLLHLFARKRESMLDDLRGMFAFCIWDAAERALFLARDAYGIKPLYYADDGETIRVASQVKALLAGGGISQEPDPAGAAGFFLLGSVPEPFTTIRAIKALPAGSYAWVRERGIAGPEQWFSLAEVFRDAGTRAGTRSSASDTPGTRAGTRSSASDTYGTRVGTRSSASDTEDDRAQLRDALLESICYHLVSDVPVGLFLSSGIDSGALLALANEAGAEPLRTVTLAFDEFRGTSDDEAPLAEELARRHGAEHTTRVVTRAEFEADLPAIFEAMDQPTIDGINSWFVSKAAAEAGLKVALSGLGGDELFGSYPSFRDIPRIVRTMALPARIPFAGDAFRLLFNAARLQERTSPKYAGLVKYGGSYAGAYLLRRGVFMPWKLASILGPEVAEEGLARLRPLALIASKLQPDPGTAYGRVATLEARLYMKNQLLRDTDWASMAHSVEVRVPLVDSVLARQVAPLALRHGPAAKRMLAWAANPRLPDEIANRSKTGFSVPLGRWVGARAQDRHDGSRRWAQEVAQRTGIADKDAPGRDAQQRVRYPGPGRDAQQRVRYPRVAQAFEPAPPGGGADVQHPRILHLTTDGFGGEGGIALYNRDLLTALASGAAEVVAIPRNPGNWEGDQPPGGVRWVRDAAPGKWRYARRVLAEIRKGTFDLVICGHINLLPLAWLAGWRLRRKPLLIIYGIDAWWPPANPVTRLLARRLDRVISISRVTLDRFAGWAGEPRQSAILPNAIHLERYGPDPRDPRLVARYGLAGKKVLMTLGRMTSEERYKGFDAVLEVLPALAREIPEVVYLAAGDGTDRLRLMQKAKDLGIRNRVIFTGKIAESEKADHYRLADVFVMPSRGEGFGFVLLEAMACGVPVIASAIDGGSEAVLGGTLGRLVDPDDQQALISAVRAALSYERGVPEGLRHFSYPEFEKRAREVLLNSRDPNDSDKAQSGNTSIMVNR